MLRKFFALILCVIMILVAISVPTCAFAEAQPSLSTLTSEELSSLQDDIDSVLSLYHTADYDQKEHILDATQEIVESHFDAKDIEISWAWVNYTYTKDWNFYTLTTHIDYKDEDGKYKPEVYSEVVEEDNTYDVYYLSVGKEVLIDRRNDLPDTRWTSLPDQMINTATGLDLSQMTTSELAELDKAAQREYSVNHTPDDKINDLLLSLTTIAVENHFDKQNIEVSWSWYDYTYTREWDLYTLTTPVSYGNHSYVTLYAEAYPLSDQYTLCYLSVDDNVLIDLRDQLPQNLFPEESNSPSILEATASPLPTATPEPTATPVPILLQKGSKGEEVKQLQEYLIQLGYLDGVADGDFGNKTKAAVEAFQKAFSLEVSGIVGNDDMEKILEAMEGLKEILELYESNRQEWIDSQFNWLDRHPSFEELIKEVLNDESSFKHIKTDYLDIADEDIKALINETLRSLGNSNRVEVGDLFIIVEFSAKNAFNATIKSTAYGIASYANNTITLAAIE